ncbi:WD40 repeat domain-containing protein [Streptosporangium saharense]|uniref:WD40 repeat domain-containing protein n=1 Tax=Streptosporangium saharense TaxID=1706840 RepID=UPI0034223219
MPRAERPLDNDGSALTRFAADLRLLRAKAGGPPYRELARHAHYSSATLADAASGRKLPSLAVTLAYVRACGGDASEWEARWRILAAESAVEKTAGEPPQVDNGGVRNPYVGLVAFQREDAEWFFGRERLVENLLSLVGERRFLVVFGSSGSGKSSLLRAGLLPATPWPTTLFTPGPHPLDECAAQLAALGTGPASAVRGELDRSPRALHLGALQALAGRSPHDELLVVVDQFEEVFTLCRDAEERARFVEALAVAARTANSRTRVVLGVRADFYARCAEHPHLAEAIGDAQLLVGAMSVEELRRAVSQPAVRAGCAVESALLARLVADTAGQASALPLLSHALRETWHRRRGNTLTLSGYERAGGVDGAIAATAEQLYTRLPASQARQARRIMLRLVNPGEQAIDTRRPASYAELIPDADSDAAQVLERLTAARLVTLHEGVVELAHEALIVSWPRLGRWIDQERDLLRVQRRLTEAATGWRDLGHDPGALYRGVRLEAARPLLARPRELTELENTFLRASVDAAAQAERAAVRRVRLARLAVAALTVLTLVAVSAAVLAVNAAGRADARSREALAHLLALRSEEFTTADPAFAGLLAAASWRFAPTAEGRHTMLTTLSTGLRGVLDNHVSYVGTVTFSPDGRTLVTASDMDVQLWDVATRRRAAALGASSASGRRDVALAFSPDGAVLATGGREPGVRLWDVATRRLLVTLPTGRTSVTLLQFSADGTVLGAVGENDVVRLWDVATRRLSTTMRVIRANYVDRFISHTTMAFTPEGIPLVAAFQKGGLRLWDLAARRVTATLPVKGTDFASAQVAFSLDGTTLAVSDEGGSVRLWDSVTHRPKGSLPSGRASALAFSPDGRILVVAGHQGNRVQFWDTATHRSIGAAFSGGTDVVSGMAFTPDGTWLAVASLDGTVRLWDTTFHHSTGHRLPGSGDANAVAFTPDGTRLAAARADGSIRLLDTDGRQAGAPLTGHAGGVDAVAFSRDGTRLASGGSDETARVWDVATRRQIGIPLTGHTGGIDTVAFSSDGTRLATGSWDGTVRLWDLTAHRQIGTPLTGHTGGVHTVAFSQDGTRLVSGSWDGTVRLWDVATQRQIGTPLADPNGEVVAVAAVAFSPDGATLASGADGEVRLWDTATHGPIGVPLIGHTGAVNVVEFSPDGATLVTADENGTVQLWDVAVRKPIGAPLADRAGAVAAVAFAPDGTTLTGAGSEGTIRRWRTEIPADPVVTLCAVVGRSLTREEWRQYVPGQPFQQVCPAA